MPLYYLLVKTIGKVLANSVRQGKEMQGIDLGRKRQIFQHL